MLCGNKSKNGRLIPATAFKSEQHVESLYLGKHVFLNHLSPELLRGTTGQQKTIATTRPIEQLAGHVVATRFIDGKPRGDIQTAGCLKGPVLVDLANAKIPNVGLSHVAVYKTRSEAGKVVVESVEDIATIDVVTCPATTHTFQEQTGMDELAKAQADLLTATQKLLAQEADLKLAREQLTAADAKLAALATEKAEADAKVVAFEQAQAAAANRAAVEAQVTAAGLVKGSDQCSAIFFEQLVSAADEAARKVLIDDRLQLVKGASRPRTTERQAATTDKTDVVTSALTSPNLFA